MRCKRRAQIFLVLAFTLILFLSFYAWRYSVGRELVRVEVVRFEKKPGELVLTTVVSNAGTVNLKFLGKVPVILVEIESEVGRKLTPVRQQIFGWPWGILTARASITNTFSIPAESPQFTRFKLASDLSRIGPRFQVEHLLDTLGWAKHVPARWVAHIPEPKPVRFWSEEIMISGKE